MILFFKKYLIQYNNITNEVCIDVRTKEQFLQSPILKNNIPVINSKQHKFLHRHKFFAEIIILYGLFINLKYIKSELLRLSNNKTSKVVIGCSKGRLRSPTVWAYAKLIGINAKVLMYGGEGK